MQIIQVLLPIVNLFPLDYLASTQLNLVVGDLVIAQFRNKQYIGIVWAIESAIQKAVTLKVVHNTIHYNWRLDQKILTLIKKTSEYYLLELGSVAKLVLPLNLAESQLKILVQQNMQDEFVLPNLSDEQYKALSQICESTKPVVLKGVTGSGKTEVYFHLIAQYLRQGKQVIVLLPEIALSEQIIQRFSDRFLFEPVIWNSSVTKAYKRQALCGILNGSVRIVIGARSSLFLPYKNLGLIIVDEEHDNSYKQEDRVLYNARDMAVLRANIERAKIVLCSATPAIETIHNINIGKYQLVTISSRHQKASLPRIEIINMRKEKMSANRWLASSLVEHIKQNLERGEQTLLFLNRRGYAPLMLCRHCGFRFACNNCSSWLTVHKALNRLECHHCGHWNQIKYLCPECLTDNTLVMCGPGIERIHEEVQMLFTGSRIAVVSKDDTTIARETIRHLLQQMINNELDILIGTQIISKGYHFPNLTLVGIIDADLGLKSGDLRASERTLQLLHQVSGRAGRAEKSGKVLLQTYYPDNIVFTTLQNETEEQFIQYELKHRQDYFMPPFSKMATILISGKQEEKVAEHSTKLVHIAPKSSARILGPAKATITKRAGYYRYRILIIAKKQFNIQQYIKVWLNLAKVPTTCRVRVDIDPYNFL